MSTPLVYLAMMVFLPFALFAGAGGLTDRLPGTLPSDETLGQWEQISGEGAAGGHHVVYRLFVDPARPALYRITQYRVTRSIADPAGAIETEKLVWNAEPGTRARLQCFEHVRADDGQWRWHRLEPDTERYRIEMSTVMAIYRLHRKRLGVP